MNWEKKRKMIFNPKINEDRIMKFKGFVLVYCWCRYVHI